ncbi:MAG: Hsp33 family molecular chaperone HslO [Defluviitaleaceae bacterium]|nr:Hsp33 family molecular chaperone HslO [Defluviitaleaceae bacterium]
MDYCIRATAASGRMRIFAAASRDLVEKSRIIHDTSPIATAALGRLLTAASIMGLMMGNDEDLLTASIRGDGPIGGLLCCADGLGRVRGYAHNPGVNLPPSPAGKLDVGGAIGRGMITITRDTGLKEPYSGTLQLVSGEIAEDIAYYFAKSEQIPTVVALGVLVERDCSVKQAGGFFIQLLPGADDSLIDALEAKIAAIPPVTAMLDGGQTSEQIIHNICSDWDYEITENHPICYQCNCSRHRAEAALCAIDPAQLQTIITEDKSAQIDCHFCNEKYNFTEEDLRGLL